MNNDPITTQEEYAEVQDSLVTEEAFLIDEEAKLYDALLLPLENETRAEVVQSLWESVKIRTIRIKFINRRLLKPPLVPIGPCPFILQPP